MSSSHSDNSANLRSLFAEENPFISREIFYESDVAEAGEKIVESEIKKSVRTSPKALPKPKRKYDRIWRFRNPQGKIIKIKNMQSFCRRHKLNYIDLTKVKYGKRRSYKGYSLP